MRRLLPLSALAFVLSLALAPAADWPRFRGPNGSGTADGPLPPIDPKAPLWKVEVPGKGVSSPIIVGGKLFLQTASTDGAKRTLLCLDPATGKTLWAKDVHGDKAKTHNKNSLASSTPASDGEQVYCVWWDGVAVSVAAYDLAGNEKWSQSLGSYSSEHGVGHSPAVYKGKVFVNLDQDGKAEVFALDAKTGTKLWSAERKPERACYTTPIVVERAGAPASIVVFSTHSVDSYDPDTGKVNWHYTIQWPAGGSRLRSVSQPVLAGGVAIGSFGEGSGKKSQYALAVRVDGSGDVSKTGKAWEVREGAPYVPSMLVKGDHLFWVNDKGTAACIDARTGKVLGTALILSGEFTASPVLVGDSIVAVSDRGQIAVVTATPELNLVSKVDLGEPALASPAVADGKLFVRGAKHLFCFGKK